MIIEHRYLPNKDSSASSGTYNVQFMPFRSSTNGMRVLTWWRDACLESCELKPEEGKCGDQKYLDDWTERFPCVHVLQHLGGGVAPWNIEQYTFSAAQAGVSGIRKADRLRFPLIFYHFHALRFYDRYLIEPTGAQYVFDKSALQLIYIPYILHLTSVATRLRQRGLAFDPHGVKPARWHNRARVWIIFWLRTLLRRNNQSGANHKITVLGAKITAFARSSALKQVHMF